jgi:hypothetical protein
VWRGPRGLRYHTRTILATALRLWGKLGNSQPRQIMSQQDWSQAPPGYNWETFPLEPNSRQSLLAATWRTNGPNVVGFVLQCYEYRHVVWVTIDGVLDCILDLLTTLQHDSELQVITAQPLISTIHKSPQHTLSLFQLAVFTSRSLVTVSNSGDSFASVLKSSLNGTFLPTELFVRVTVTCRLTVWRQSSRLGKKPLEI